MVRAGLTTERVVAAAADLADSIGFDQVTVSAVARGFGVKDASLYGHVGGLQDLRTRVALLAAGEFADRLSEAVAGRAGRDALVGFAYAYREFALEHPGRYQATQLRIDPEVAQQSSAFRRTVSTIYGMMRAYRLAEPALTDAVRMLRSTLHGFSDLEADGAFRAARDVEASWERTVEALHTVLENWQAEPAAERSATTDEEHETKGDSRAHRHADD
ncbi:TetR-like C-terminal domain-containing protein [Streptomyces californicus]|uniref:TetR-like C-terminal domain-containing protein n=1 Tax=Streptomyces TaxID=1883 RepID=UPI001901E3AE|nr:MULTISPECIES: TetR-like C-terminal domain-containing protein [unclassified Streptomyces]MBK0373059.1 WHG domain-containing protein [Streptomyces sp. RB110-1]MBK0390573.1 WHG domain-containing protein [Streptomyces sp. RB110-2]